MSHSPRPIVASTLIRLILIGVLGLTGTVMPEIAAEPVTSKADRGTIGGSVLDDTEKTPLHGATIELHPSGKKTGTNPDGEFEFTTLAAGSYTIIVTFVGYTPDTLSGLLVQPGQATRITARLHALPVEGQTIVVTGAVDPLPPENGAGTLEISTGEIRSRPGAMGDINRAVAGMPTIARFDDRFASLVVRGGSPVENGYYIDKIPVPNISHFPSQGNAGGPLGLLNSTIIDDATFYTGGFSVAYGDRMSSVLDISLRDGNRREFAGQADLSVSGASVTVEGPIANHRGSWLVCGRHSFLDLLQKAVNLDATPSYDDLYTKLSRSIDSTSSISIVGLLGRGDFYIDRNVSYQSGVDFYGQMDYSTGTLGLAWNRTWSGRHTAHVSLAYSHLNWTNDNKFTASDAALYINESSENAVTLRTVNSRHLGERFQSRFGGEMRYLEAAYDFTLADYANESGYLNPEIAVTANPDFISGGLWLEQDWRPDHRFTATLGVRADILGYAAHHHLAPRGALRFKPKDGVSLYVAGGLYYQSLPLVVVLQHDANKDLRDSRALHLVTGLGVKLGRSLRLNLEGYFKRYDRMPMDTTQPSVFILDELVYNYGFVAGHYPLVDNGRSDVYGGEAAVSFRSSEQFSARFGLALSRARYQGVDRVWRNRIIDNRVASDMEFSWRPDPGWGMSARWIYGGGRPYTPLNESESKSHGAAVFETELANSVRLPAYHSLNVRVERRFTFRSSDLTIYTELWNAYNRRNVAGQYWDPDSNESGRVHQFPRVPILGVEYRF